MKLKLVLASLFLAIAAFAASNAILPWDTFTDVKAKLASGAVSGSSGTNNITLTGGGANSFVVTNFATTSIGAISNLQFQTPFVTAGTAVLSKVLKLTDATTGKVEFGAPYALAANATYDAPSIPTNGVVSTTVTNSGCVPGDLVLVSLSTVGTNAVIVQGNVSATNIVTVRIFNPTAAAVDLASGTLRVATLP